jgi:hypothetical protein
LVPLYVYSATGKDRQRLYLAGSADDKRTEVKYKEEATSGDEKDDGWEAPARKCGWGAHKDYGWEPPAKDWSSEAPYGPEEIKC